MAHRGVDLLDLYRDRLTIRRFRVLVRGLPGDSRTAAVIRRLRRESGTATPVPIEELPVDAWDTTQWMLATVIDEVRALAWMYSSTHRKHGSPAPPRPEPFPRPGGQKRRRRRVNAFFAAFGLPPLDDSTTGGESWREVSRSAAATSPSTPRTRARASG